ncbi:MAG: asparagine synthase (glutamine-hydrolyzing) [Flavobacteriales bacterium]|nr:asparagine synthase (glutamine-hydrolyzing) [Flavobacteriales bacterium]
MCGIAGIWNFNNQAIDESEFIRFTDSLQHRGPDNRGTYFSPNKQLALGHRRLSIIDLSTSGNQPMSYADSPYLICYNGEVFNYLELRDELITKGYKFYTSTDTEVVLVAYIEWGIKCLDKFNGMWAMAIWNKKTEELFLSRDRFGIKPLYYSYSKMNSLLFASETIAFKNYSPYHRKINTDNLNRSIHDSNLLEGIGYTIYDNIYQLLPGHYAKINCETKRFQQNRWWNTFGKTVGIPTSYQDQVQEFGNLFKDSCLLRLRSDVNIGTALSGGVDSSSVYCMLHNLNNQGEINKNQTSNSWQQAYIATFPGTKQDERAFAEKVIDYTKGNGNYIVPDYSSLADDIVSSTKLFDSITGTPIFIVSTIYNAMKKDGITVSMDGHGVDEMMYGYQSNVQEAYFNALLTQDIDYSNDLMSTFADMFISSETSTKKTQLSEKGSFIIDFEEKIENEFFLKKFGKKLYHLFDRNYASPSIKMDNLLGGKTTTPLDHLSDTPYNFSEMSRDEKSLAISFHFRDIPYNLRDFDRASMQESVEIRMPFMDWRIVNYTFSLPVKSKIGSGYTKKILRDSMKGIMPDEIRKRKLKIGLSAPIENWLSTELKELVLDQLNSSSFLHSQHWDGPKINNYFQTMYEKNTFEKSDSIMLWKLLNAQLIVND